LPQCLAHGRPRSIKAIGQLLFVQRGSGGQPAGSDLVGQHIADAVGEQHPLFGHFLEGQDGHRVSSPTRL
jgi:hypothetical protein